MFTSRHTKFLEREHQRLLEEIKDLKNQLDGYRVANGRLAERLAAAHSAQMPSNAKEFLDQMDTLFEEPDASNANDEARDDRKPLDTFAG